MAGRVPVDAQPAVSRDWWSGGRTLVVGLSCLRPGPTAMNDFISTFAPGGHGHRFDRLIWGKWWKMRLDDAFSAAVLLPSRELKPAWRVKHGEEDA